MLLSVIECLGSTFSSLVGVPYQNSDLETVIACFVAEALLDFLSLKEYIDTDEMKINAVN